MIPLLLAALLAVQDPPAQRGEWRDLDGILIIINEEAVTKRDFVMQRQKFMSTGTVSDPKRASLILQEEIKNAAVGSQAGEALGLDTNLIKRVVHDHERRLIEAHGGVDQYTQFLAQQGLTPDAFRTQIEKQVYRDFWESMRTGSGPNQQQKFIADRYIRPGILRLTYKQLAHDPRMVTRIQGQPATVVLQILEIDPVKVGGTAQAESEAAAIRARIASGASDFEAESGKAMTGSVSGPREPVDEGGLAEIDPQLAKLVAQAKEGDLLPPIAPHEKTPQWRIVRLVKRNPAVVPAFVAPGVQDSLRDLRQAVLDNGRLELARRQQFESSYIWVWEPPAAAP
jgi:hypothetical protein